jgi:hypothetical protein
MRKMELHDALIDPFRRFEGDRTDGVIPAPNEIAVTSGRRSAKGVESGNPLRISASAGF